MKATLDPVTQIELLSTYVEIYIRNEFTGSDLEAMNIVWIKRSNENEYLINQIKAIQFSIYSKYCM